MVFSFVGYKTVTVNYTDGKAVSVKMELETASLEEVQVVAYGAQKKRTVVSAISSVKADELKELPTHSLENLLQGHMAGVEISNISGSPGGGGSLVAIRGYNSLFVEGEGDDRNYGTPLYVIDGVPMQSFTGLVQETVSFSSRRRKDRLERPASPPIFPIRPPGCPQLPTNGAVTMNAGTI